MCSPYDLAVECPTACALLTQVERTVGQALQLNSPFVVISANTLLAQEKMKTYEDLRDERQVIIMDVKEHVEKFQRQGNRIIFMSHECDLRVPARRSLAPLPSWTDASALND